MSNNLPAISAGAAWFFGIAAFCGGLVVSAQHDVKECEVRIAGALNT